MSRIDPRTDKVAATIAVGGSPQAITVADGRAWVTVDAQTVTPSDVRGASGTLRIESTAEVGSLDPALVNNLLDGQVLQATCARLLNFAEEPGPAGSLPTPEVSQSLPALSGDGKTYTFTIRPGFRFSPPMSEPVTAQTFKDSIERAFNPKIKGWAVDFNDIAGVRAYEAGQAAHISGIVARGNTLTFHLVSPNPDFLARLTEPPMCAVPSGTPINPNQVRVIPSAGPYYVQSYTPGQSVVLVRNPNYHGRRPQHFERIQLTLGVPARRAVADVEAGRADYTTLASGAPSASSGLPAGIAAEAARLAARYGPGSAAAARRRQQYFVSPIMQLDYFVLNTHRPLF
ncbi:MAG: hypothetical protein JO363_18800, partial [Solirubrobacterales bacterium]|nr:hypothetical protein [Solirubrobacterales bacterium]